MFSSTNPGHRLRYRSAVPVLVAAVLGTTLAGCGSSSEAGTGAATAAAPAAGPTSAAQAPASASAAGLTVTDAWVKAAPSGMTAMFGAVRNTTSAPITIMSGSTPVAGAVELHETVEVDGAMQMRPKTGGFVVPAGEVVQLAPGGNHVMLMGLTDPIEPGDQVTVTLTLSNGSTLPVAALGKDFAGAKESYAPSPSGSMAAMEGMS